MVLDDTSYSLIKFEMLQVRIPSLIELNRALNFDFVRFGSEIELTEKLVVRFRWMTEQHRIKSFDVVVVRFRLIEFDDKFVRFCSI